MEPTLRLHAFVPRSRANGPGWRSVVWTQGCSLCCPGCFNPDTHAFTGGTIVSIEDLVRQVVTLGDTIEGITVSGGEPLQQRPAMLALLRCLRNETSLSVILFTGFSWEEVNSMPNAAELLGHLDVLIAGRYREEQRVASGLRGSANKTIHLLTSWYSLNQIERTPEAEVTVLEDGTVWVSGVEPLRLERS